MTGERMLLPGRALPTGGRPVRALLLLGSLVLLLIAGLLGMHALGASAAGHGASAAVPAAAGSVLHASAPTDHGTMQHATAGHPVTAGIAAPVSTHATSPKPTTALDGDAVGPGHDHGVLMACVLALLAGLIVLARPSVVLGAWLAVLLQPRSLRPPPTRAALPPPSLTLLSISRT